MITKDPYGISHAERPWVSPGARRTEHINTYDTPEQIARCQNCAWSECVDCIGIKSDRRKTIRNVERDKEFLRPYEAGKTDKEIAQAMGITTTTVFYRRQCHGLRPNRRRS